MRRLAVLLVLAALAGCQAFPIQLRSELGRDELLPYAAAGDRHIWGQAMLPLPIGVETCAGDTAVLLPDIPVVRESIRIWKAGDRIYTVNLERPNVAGSVRWSACDVDGNFVFEGLAPLTYWVFVPVSWGTHDEESGGWLSRKVSLEHGSESRLILNGDDKGVPEARPWEITAHLN